MRLKLCWLLFSVFFWNIAWAKKKTYFQQKVNTTIHVKLDDVNHMLRGTIELEYINNSPDTLTFIYMHLYPNAYKNNHTANAQQMINNGSAEFWNTSSDDKGWIDSLSFKIDGTVAKIQATQNIDVVKLMLPNKLLPGATIKIYTPFKLKIPYMTSRLGHVGQSYQLTQWFPKPAVYDKDGWHAFPYLNYGEFYSEFGAYDVTITLPVNYIVMATGNLITHKEQQWIDSLASLNTNAFPPKNAVVPSSEQYKTIRFLEDNVHDFAWFADKNWILRKETFALEESTDSITAYSAFYQDNIKGFGNSVNYLKEAILGYGKYVGAYPYKTVKSVAGPLKAGGGMEYPTITIIDDFENAQTVREVIIHEVGHNWFYGILGTNERSYPFMDESINSFFEKKIVEQNNITEPFLIYKKNKVDTINNTSPKPQTKAIENVVIYTLSKANSLTPMCAHSADFKELNYGLDIYQKGERYFNWLCEYMGEDNFIAAMHTYFDNWKFKHPQPDDLKNVLQQHTDKSIDWFFDDAIKMHILPDFKLKKITSNTLHITNKRSVALPAAVTFSNSNGEKNTIWTPPFKGRYNVNVHDSLGELSNAYIATAVPDESLPNNFVRKSYKLKPFTALFPSTSYNMYYMPAIGYNSYDKVMLGGAIHNVAFPARNIEYALVPMYSFGSNTFVYAGIASYLWRVNNKSIKDIMFVVNSKRFSYFQSAVFDDLQLQYWKNKLSVAITFMPKSYSSSVEKKLDLSFYNISSDKVGYILENNNIVDFRKNGYNNNQYLKATYSINANRKFFPYYIKLSAIGHQDFTQLSVDAKYKINYTGAKKGIEMRIFGGKLLGNRQNIPSYAHLNITSSGWTDFLFDETFVGRGENQGFWSNQSSSNLGGFYSHTQLMSVPIGRSNNYLLAFNLNVDVPKTPLTLFGNIAYAQIDQALLDGLGITPWQYEAGVAINVWDRFQLALPIMLSPDLNDNRKFNLGRNKILKTIAFRMDLKDILPSKNLVKYAF
jgi:hypothetical protein